MLNIQFFASKFLDTVESNFYLILLIISTFISIYYLKQKFNFWSKRGVKDKHLIDYMGMFGAHHKYTLDMFNKHGRIYGGYMLTKMFVVINEPDLIRDICVKHFNELPNHTEFNIGPSPKVNKMLFFIPGDDQWKSVRSIVSPTFTSGKLRQMICHISDISDKFVISLEMFAKTGQPVDMRRHIGAFAMDVVCACAYGINIDSINNPDHPILVNVRKILSVNASLKMGFCVLAPKLARWLRINYFDMDAIDFLDQLIDKIFAQRRKTNSVNKFKQGKEKTDFIQLMLDSEKTSNENQNSCSDSADSKPAVSLTQEQMTAQAITFLVAGYDTTSSALSHMVYYLSQNKDCQHRLYEELKCVKEFTYENLSQLKYLNAVIDETLRLAPPLLRIQRQGSTDIEIGGIKIPAGTSIEILPYALHRDPDLWPDPLKFKPERFLNPTHHPWALFPFGGGPRICIGKRFSLNEMRMCCAKLFNKFEFSLLPGFKIEYFQPNIVLAPKSVMVTIKYR